jgi:DNA-binding NarL/FixJ family response regulator
MAIRILLADDHMEFRDSLRRALEQIRDYEIVAEASSGVEAIELARSLHPDIALVDVRMTKISGIHALPQLMRDTPSMRVLIVSMHNDKRYVSRSIKAGARGYLLKDSLDEWLPRAIAAVLKGDLFFTPSISPVFAD